MFSQYISKLANFVYRFSQLKKINLVKPTQSWVRFVLCFIYAFTAQQQQTRSSAHQSEYLVPWEYAGCCWDVCWLDILGGSSDRLRSSGWYPWYFDWIIYLFASGREYAGYAPIYEARYPRKPGCIRIWPVLAVSKSAGFLCCLGCNFYRRFAFYRAFHVSRELWSTNMVDKFHRLSMLL